MLARVRRNPEKAGPLRITKNSKPPNCQREARKLEHDYSILNKENISAANELILRTDEHGDAVG